MLWIATRFLFVGYVLVWFAAIYFYLAIPRARRASVRYLDRMQRHRGKPRRSALIRAWQTYRHMVTFGILLVDRALMLARPSHGFHIDAQGLEHLREAAALADAHQSGIVMLTAHHGMAEIAAPYFSIMGIQRRVNIVMYQDPRDGTEHFHSRHRRMLKDINVISTTDPLGAGIKIIAALKRGDVVAMRADRTLAGKTVEVTLLGERVLLPAGPFVAAVLSGSPVVDVYTCRTGYRKYSCTISAVRRYGAEVSDEARDAQIARACRNLPRIWKRYCWNIRISGRIFSTCGKRSVRPTLLPPEPPHES